MKIILLVFFTFCFSHSLLAAEVLTVDGKVTSIVSFPKTYGNYSNSAQGLVGFYVKDLPKGCGSGQNRVVIDVDHPLYNSALSLALTAHSTGKSVRIAYFNTCTLRSGSWDFAYLMLM